MVAVGKVVVVMVKVAIVGVYVGFLVMLLVVRCSDGW